MLIDATMHVTTEEVFAVGERASKSFQASLPENVCRIYTSVLTGVCQGSGKLDTSDRIEMHGGFLK